MRQGIRIEERVSYDIPLGNVELSYDATNNVSPDGRTYSSVEVIISDDSPRDVGRLSVSFKGDDVIAYRVHKRSEVLCYVAGVASDRTVPQEIRQRVKDVGQYLDEEASRSLSATVRERKKREAREKVRHQRIQRSDGSGNRIRLN